MVTNERLFIWSQFLLNDCTVHGWQKFIETKCGQSIKFVGLFYDRIVCFFDLLMIDEKFHEIRSAIFRINVKKSIQYTVLIKKNRDIKKNSIIFRNWPVLSSLILLSKLHRDIKKNNEGSTILIILKNRKFLD